MNYTSALLAGYTAQQILDFLVRDLPFLGKRIKQAKNAGHDVTKILKEMQNLGKKELEDLDRKAQTEQGNNPLIEAQQRTLKSSAQEEGPPLAGKAALGALGLLSGVSAYQLAKLGPQVAMGKLLPPLSPGALKNPIQPNPNTPLPGSPTIQLGHQQIPIEPNPTPTNPVPGSSFNPAEAQILSSAPKVENVSNDEIDINPQNTLEPLTEEDKAYQRIFDRQKESARLFELAKEKRPGKEGATPFMRMARELVKKGQIKSPQEMDEFRKYWMATEGQKRGSPFVEFEDFRSQRPKFQEASKLSPALQPQEIESKPEKFAENLQNKVDLREKILQIPKLVKEDMVISPIGLGRIKEIRNGKAMLEVDGKKHVIDEDELIESPLPEKDLADLYEDVIGGIEKQTGQEVSRNVNWAGYDPNANELAYRPHDGALYIYDDISPEDVEELTSLLNQRKTTGSNFIGAWQSGSQSPIGAAMSRLIQRLQKERGGKGNEYTGKFQTLYDAIEPAVKAAKAKHAEERKRKKKT